MTKKSIPSNSIEVNNNPINMLTGAKGTEDCHMFLQHARYNLCFKRMFSTGELILEKIKAQEKQTRRDVTS